MFICLRIMLEKVYLEITEECNLDCNNCFRKSWNKPAIEMDDPTRQKVIAEINQSESIRTVVLGGIGEPFMSASFEKTVNQLKEKSVWVTTNGLHLKEKLTPALLKKIDKLIVSADGMEKNMLVIRGIQMNEWMQNLSYLNQLKQKHKTDTPALEIQFVASRQNIADIFPLMDILADLNVHKIHISHILPVDDEGAEQILYKRYENKETRQLFNKIRNYSFKKGLQVVLPEYELRTERHCAFVDSNATYVTAEGMVVPCYRFSHDGREYVFGRKKTILQYSFGSVKEQALNDIWESLRYRSFRSRIYNNHFPSCTDCDLVEGCDLVNHTEFDCHGHSPSCSDCVWARNFVFCN